jgi:hypothetical protein
VKPIPADTPFDEYEHMRSLRCECGGELTWGERTCERLTGKNDRYVIDRYELTCRKCAAKRPIAFRCDTGSDLYAGLASAAGLAAGLGPEGAILAAAAGEAFTAPPAPSRAKKKRKKRATRRGPSGR